MTTATVETQVRPTPPRRTISMAVPLVVASTAMVLGAATAEAAFGAVWGVIAALGLIAALQMGRVTIDNLDRVAVLLGMTATTVLMTRVLPGPPEVIDVLLCLAAAAACLPIAVATSVVAARAGLRPTSVINIALAWLFAGGFSLPAGRTLGIIVPLSDLRLYLIHI